jgi:hypothetical protein
MKVPLFEKEVGVNRLKKFICFFILFLLSCIKVDNSELCQWRVMFVNNRNEMVEVQMEETGGVFEINPHDSINFPVSSSQPTLTMSYKAFIYPNHHQELICERNVHERNVFNYDK